MSRITASLVCFKTPVAELEPLFQLLASSTAPAIDWVVVDNAAYDAPLQARELEAAVERFGGRYVPSRNVGFGAGHNKAILTLRDTPAEFHLMVNPDITFGADVLTKLMQVFANHPRAVRVMPRVRFSDGSEQKLCKLLPTPVDFALRRFLPARFQHFAQARLDQYELKGLADGPSVHVPFLSGCFIFLRWETLRLVGGFDDRYFLYMEDVDLCRRLAAHGDLLYWPAVDITHGFHRGSHVSFKLMLRHLQSSWHYYNRWGWISDRVGDRINREALAALKVQG